MSFYKCKPVPPENAQNVVIYARYSSDNQTENSIDGQLRVCNQYIESHNLHLIRTYIDRAASGTTDKRSDFQNMICDARKQQFAYILVYRLDRFARSHYDSAIYKKQLSELGVRVISATESFGDGDEGMMMEAIVEAMDEIYSRRLSTITSRGMEEAARKGLWTGGTVPFGYAVVDHHLVPDERTVPAVRMIFDMYADGSTKSEIVKALNESGYKTTKKKTFQISSLDTILTNRIYTGVTHCGTVEYDVPAIIDSETFAKVQKNLERNRKLMGRKTEVTFYPLSGKLYCGYCGSAIVGDAGTGRGGIKYHYYSCPKKKKDHTCEKRTEHKEELEDYICRLTLDYVLTPDMIKKISARVSELSKQNPNAAQIERIEKQIAAIDRDIDEAVNALYKTTASVAVERINARIEELQTRQQAAKSELAELRIDEGLSISEQDIESYLHSFDTCDDDVDSYRRRIIETFINSAFLYNDHIVIYYNIKDGKQVSYFDMISDMSDLEKEKEPSERDSDSSSVAPHILNYPNTSVIITPLHVILIASALQR